MAKKEKIEEVESVDNNVKIDTKNYKEVSNEIINEEVHEFIVKKQFCLDKIYNPNDLFLSNNTQVTNFLLTNKFIK